MGLFVRIVPTTGAIAATADGATYASCGDTEIALFVGKTGPTARMKGIMIQGGLRRMAHQLARKPGAVPGVKATGTITVGTEVNDDTVTIDGTELIVKATSASNVQVAHGATPAATAINLVRIINAHPTISTKVHAVIDGTTPEQVNLTAKAAGTTANGYTLAEGGTTFTVSGATLSGGTIRRGSVLMTPETRTYTKADKQTTDNVTESTIGIVYGQTAWANVTKSRALVTNIERLLRYYKRVYGRKA